MPVSIPLSSAVPEAKHLIYNDYLIAGADGTCRAPDNVSQVRQSLLEPLDIDAVLFQRVTDLARRQAENARGFGLNPAGSLHCLG